MKFIPKYRLGDEIPWDGLFNNIDDYITWDDNWVGSQKSESPTGFDLLSEQFKVGKNSPGRNNLYGFFNNKGSWLEDYTPYSKFTNSFFDSDGNLTGHGKSYINLFIKYSPNINLTKILSEIRDKHNWNITEYGGIQRPGYRANTWRELIEGIDNNRRGLANDGNYSIGHHVNKGTVYHFTGADGKTMFIPKEKIEDNTYTIKNTQNNDLNNRLLSLSPYGVFSDFVEVEETNPNKIYTSQVTNEEKPYLPQVTDVVTRQFKPRVDNDLTDVGNSEGGDVDDDKTKRTGIPGILTGAAKGLGKGIRNVYNLLKNASIQGKNGDVSPAWAQGLRVAIDNAFNTANTENLIKNMDIALTNYTPVYRLVHGDYVSQQLAQREAARFRTSLPVTSNLQIQSAFDLEGVQKGNLLILQGNAKDALMFWNTSEQAFQLAKENARGWDNVANTNRASLVKFNNDIALLRFNTKKRNMQNWDDFLADMESRAWEKWDREEAKKILAKEELEKLYDELFGLKEINEKLKELDVLLEQLIRAGKRYDSDPELQKIVKEVNRLNSIKSARIHYNKLNRLGLFDKNLWNILYGTDKDYNFLDPNWAVNIFKDPSEIVTSSLQTEILGLPRRKDGGILTILLQGGEFGVVAKSSAGKSNKFLAAAGFEKSSTSKSSSKSSGQSDDEKTKEKLLGNIAETLKGIDGLNSDVNILYNELSLFFDIQRYISSASNDPMLFYSMYIRALNRVNLVKLSAKSFDSAYKELEKRRAIGSPAIDSNGKVFVGIDGTTDVIKVTPEEYLNNTDKYHLIRNNELLELRMNNPMLAFSDKYITEAAYNGTNIEDIHKYIKDVLGTVGSDELSRDLLVKQYGKDAALGLLVLNDLISGRLSDSNTASIIAGLQGTLTEMNVSVKLLAAQAKLALNTIQAMLPANMRALLILHAGSTENVNKLLTSFVLQGLDSSISFKINDISMLDENGNLKEGKGKDGSGGSSSGSDKEPIKDQTLVSIIRGIGGTPDKIKINKGGKSLMSIDATNYNIEGAYHETGLRNMLSETKIMGISDPRHIYFGDYNIPSEFLNDIAYTGQGLSRVMLPILSDGSPDFTILSRFETICNIARHNGINPLVALSGNGDEESKKKMAQIMRHEGLYGLIDSNGLPNLNKFGLFLLTEGITSSRIGIKQSDYIVLDDSKSDKLEQILTVHKSNGDVATKYELDKKHSLNPFDWGGNYEKVFVGTIYIPINPNELQADIASGNKYKDSDAQGYEEEFQAALKRNSFKDREY